MIKYATFIVIGVSLLLSISGDVIDQTSLIEKYTDQQSRFMSLDGNRIHYRDEGKGQVILLLHGTASSLHTWDAWAKILAKEFRVIRMDLPGFALTGPDIENRYEVNDDVEFLNKFLSKLGLQDVHLVGSSLGGRIAWAYSLAHQEQIRSLTLINSLGYPQERWPPAIEMAQWPFIDIIMSKVSPRFLYALGLEDVYFDASHVTDEVVDRYYELSRYPGNLDAFPRRVKAKLDTQSDQITNISVPTLILWGKEDIYFPVESANRFKEDIVLSSLIVYDDVGHLPMEEVSGKSVNDFLGFLTKHLNE